MELSLGYEHQWGIFGWNSNYTFSTNRNEVLELMENYTHPETGNVISLDQLKVGGFANAAFVLTPGGTLGDLYTTVDLNRDEFGNVYVDKDPLFFYQSHGKSEYITGLALYQELS